jgi:hypothetical protein
VPRAIVTCAAGTLTVVSVLAAVAGCSAPSDGRKSGSCSQTQPSSHPEYELKGFNYGNRAIGVALWPKGVLTAGPLPGGGMMATVNPDGSIHAKQGWWREVKGSLRITGTRLDRSAPPLRADVPEGYESTGFQPVGLIFPTTGCWRVVGHLGDARLAYVVRVVKVGS